MKLVLSKVGDDDTGERFALLRGRGGEIPDWTSGSLTESETRKALQDQHVGAPEVAELFRIARADWDERQRAASVASKLPH